jgi:hypothetical protein
MTTKPFGLLTVGNVVNAALRLYGANFKRYLRLSIFAHLWLLLAIFILAVAIASSITLATNGGIILSGGISLVSLAIFIYSLAKYCLELAVILRLCFDELIEQPESNREGRSQVSKKFWSFLIIFIGISIRLFLVYFGFGVLYFAIAIALVLIYGDPSNLGVIASTVAGVMFLAFFMVATFISSRLVARWIVAELPLAVEPDFNPSKSVKRSWELTKSSVNRIQAIITVAFLVTIPLEITALVITEFVQVAFEGSASSNAIAFGVTVLFTLGVNVIVMPFWQAIKAVIYYDLRNRREGLDLELRSTGIVR